jgi:hypothetical protein
MIGPAPGGMEISEASECGLVHFCRQFIRSV